jgi:hypothetical protein
MIERKNAGVKMVAMQLTTDEGAFVCNINESDIPKMTISESGTFITLYCAIRLDAMIEGQYELYRTKRIETSSIDFHQPFQKRVRIAASKR